MSMFPQVQAIPQFMYPSSRSLSPLPVVKKKGRPKKEVEDALPLPQRKEKEVEEPVPPIREAEESLPLSKRKGKEEEEEEESPPALPLPQRRGREVALPARKPLSPPPRPAR